MKVSCSNGFAPGDVVRRRVLLEIEKSSSQVFFLSLTPLMRPWIVKMTWSYPKMPFPQRVRLLFGSLSPSKFGDEISSFADPGCLSQTRIPDPDFFHPRSRILDQNFLHPGSLIPDLNFFHPISWIPDAH